MGRIEHYCPITGEKQVIRVEASSSDSPEFYYSPGADIDAIDAYEKRELETAQHLWLVTHPTLDGFKHHPARRRHAHQVRP